MRDMTESLGDWYTVNSVRGELLTLRSLTIFYIKTVHKACFIKDLLFRDKYTAETEDEINIRGR